MNDTMIPTITTPVTTKVTSVSPCPSDTEEKQKQQQQQQQQQQPKPQPVVSRKRSLKRTVLFKDACIRIVPNQMELSTEERNAIWYPQDELEFFREEARTMCRQLRTEPTRSYENCSTRGLESRVSLKRQHHRLLSIKCVMKAQERSREVDFIAIISQKCTLWSTKVAILEAQRDYCEIYQPNMLSMLPSVEDIPCTTGWPIQFKKKRQQAQEAVVVPAAVFDQNNDAAPMTNRRVRRRISI
jgi:hypothetical protein